MNKRADLMQQLSDHFFWDVEISEIDPESSKRLIIERVFSLGDVTEMKAILAYYGHETVAEELGNVKYLDPKTLNFVSILFDKSKETYRCYTPKSSTIKHWNS